MTIIRFTLSLLVLAVLSACSGPVTQATAPVQPTVTLTSAPSVTSTLEPSPTATVTATQEAEADVPESTPANVQTQGNFLVGPDGVQLKDQLGQVMWANKYIASANGQYLAAVRDNDRNGSNETATHLINRQTAEVIPFKDGIVKTANGMYVWWPEREQVVFLDGTDAGRWYGGDVGVFTRIMYEADRLTFFYANNVRVYPGAVIDAEGTQYNINMYQLHIGERMWLWLDSDLSLDKGAWLEVPPAPSEHEMVNMTQQNIDNWMNGTIQIPKEERWTDYNGNPAPFNLIASVHEYETPTQGVVLGVTAVNGELIVYLGYEDSGGNRFFVPVRYLDVFAKNSIFGLVVRKQRWVTATNSASSQVVLLQVTDAPGLIFGLTGQPVLHTAITNLLPQSPDRDSTLREYRDSFSINMALLNLLSQARHGLISGMHKPSFVNMKPTDILHTEDLPFLGGVNTDREMIREWLAGN